MTEVVVAVALYFVTRALDKAAVSGSITLPVWMVFGTADAARQMLTTLAAAVIAVVGIVFSIMIVTLALASTQFGPRMLRNFIRDRGTQFTLGTFVATFVYATLVLISIGPGTSGRTSSRISRSPRPSAWSPSRWPSSSTSSITSLCRSSCRR